MNMNKTMLIIRNIIRKKSLIPIIVGRNARKLEIKKGITRNITATIIVRK